MKPGELIEKGKRNFFPTATWSEEAKEAGLQKKPEALLKATPPIHVLYKTVVTPLGDNKCTTCERKNQCGCQSDRRSSHTGLIRATVMTIMMVMGKYNENG